MGDTVEELLAINNDTGMLRRIQALETALKDDYERMTRRIFILETVITDKFGRDAILSGEKLVCLLDKNMMRLRSGLGTSSRLTSPLKRPARAHTPRRNVKRKLQETSESPIKIEPETDSEVHEEEFELENSETMFPDNDGDEVLSTEPNFEEIEEIFVTRSGRQIKRTPKYSATGRKLKVQVDGNECWTPQEEAVASDPGPEDKNMCDQCGKTLSNRRNLRAHRLRVHFAHKQKYQCTFCGKGFPTEFKRNYHSKIHTEVRPHKCEVSGCEAAFKFRTQLTVHQRVHQSTKGFACTVCGKRYKHKSGISIHMLTHKQLRLYSCPKCGKKFYTRTHVKRHLMQFHKIEDENIEIPKETQEGENAEDQEKGEQEEGSSSKKPRGRHSKPKTPRKPVARVVCDQCGATVLKNNFKHHLTTHEILFSCDQCGKGFSTEFGLKSHVEHAHDLDKPFLCDYPECDSRFNSISNLRTHQISHTEERKYRCEPCNRSYKHKGGLKVHINACHSKVKQFPCQLCDSAEPPRIFDTRTHLKRHMTKVHKIDKEEAERITKVEKEPKPQPRKIPCDYCSKSYKNKHDLRLHMNAAHTHETEFNCSICSKVFYRKNHLKRHMEKIHSVEMPDVLIAKEELDYEEVSEIEAVEIHEAPIPSGSGGVGGYPRYQTIQLNPTTIVQIVTEFDVQEPEEIIS